MRKWHGHSWWPSRPTDTGPGPQRLSPELKDAWGSWIADQGPWHIFGGLTYDQRRQPQGSNSLHKTVARDVAIRHATDWLSRAAKATGGRVEAGVVALEYQKNGWPHFHPLLRLAGGMGGREFEVLGHLWYERHGYARLEEPRSQNDVSAYASKYLVKDLSRGEIVLWPPRGRWPVHDRGLELQELGG